MDLGRPFQVITPTVDGDVIAVLARADAAFTPAQVRALAGRHSVEGVRRALNRLVEQGIVNSQRTPTAGLYSLNPEHLAAPALRALAVMRVTFLDRLRDRVDGWDPPPRYAAVYGSAARGTMRVDSDIDVFVVRPADTDPEDGRWHSQVLALEADASRWTGNDVRVLQWAEGDIGPGDDAAEPVLADIRDEGLNVHGPPGWLRQRLRRSAH